MNRIKQFSQIFLVLIFLTSCRTSIIKEDSQEKICTWKSVPATKDCNMEKDKGCKITKPDKIGREKIYLLEK